MVLVSQLLLIALALAWAIHMTLVAANGAVYFVESNPVILWIEIIVTVLIGLFGMTLMPGLTQRMGNCWRQTTGNLDSCFSKLNHPR
jgi:amino acid transporter